MYPDLNCSVEGWRCVGRRAAHLAASELADSDGAAAGADASGADASLFLLASCVFNGLVNWSFQTYKEKRPQNRLTFVMPSFFFILFEHLPYMVRYSFEIS